MRAQVYTFEPSSIHRCIRIFEGPKRDIWCADIRISDFTEPHMESCLKRFGLYRTSKKWRPIVGGLGFEASVNFKK